MVVVCCGYVSGRMGVTTGSYNKGGLVLTSEKN